MNRELVSATALLYLIFVFLGFVVLGLPDYAYASNGKSGMRGVNITIFIYTDTSQVDPDPPEPGHGPDPGSGAGSELFIPAPDVPKELVVEPDPGETYPGDDDEEDADLPEELIVGPEPPGRTPEPPKTGEFPPIYFYAVGALLVLVGLLLRRKDRWSK